MTPDHESKTVQIECEMAFLEEERPPDPSVSTRRSDAIFVSHSEAQKEFVERLCKDLERADLSPFFENCPGSSSKGEEFAHRISTAAQNCELAIVVVSDEYFTRSKWPMLELVALVQTKGRKILPLFLGLSCKEFKNSKRRERWFPVWNPWTKSDSGICLDTWKDALRELDGRNGVEYANASAEVDYRKEIVTTVCSIVQWRSHDEKIDVENAKSPGIQGLRQPGECATRPKGRCSYFRMVLLTPIIFISILCLGSIFYSVFFCDQGYPFPYGIIFPSVPF